MSTGARPPNARDPFPAASERGRYGKGSLPIRYWPTDRRGTLEGVAPRVASNLHPLLIPAKGRRAHTSRAPHAPDQRRESKHAVGGMFRSARRSAAPWGLSRHRPAGRRHNGHRPPQVASGCLLPDRYPSGSRSLASGIRTEFSTPSDKSTYEGAVHRTDIPLGSLSRGSNDALAAPLSDFPLYPTEFFHGGGSSCF